MKIFDQILIRHNVQAALKIAERQAAEITGEQRTYMPGIYRVIGLVSMVFFSAAAILSWRASHSGLALTISLFFAFGIPVPLLISCRNCWVRYNEEGFTVSNFWGIRRCYTYSDVTARTQGGGNMDFKRSDGTYMRMDGQVNGKAFFTVLCRMTGKETAILHPHPMGMQEAQLKESYASGLLRETMFVNPEQLSSLNIRKNISHIMIRISSVCLLGVYCSRLDLPGVLIPLGLTLLSMGLYYKNPDYYTAREHVGKEWVGELAPLHKCCNMFGPSLCALLSSAVYYVHHMDSLYGHGTVYIIGEGNPWKTGSSYGICILITVLQLLVFKKYSREYREYRLGMVSFGVYAFCTGAVFGILSRFLMH